MKTRTFGKKCKCGHFESEHKSQTIESNPTKDYDIKPIGNLPMGLAPTIHYDSRRDNCKICDCKKFTTSKREFWNPF